MNEQLHDPNDYEQSDFHERIRNIITKPLVGEGIFNGTPPDWFMVLRLCGNNYRHKMAQALIRLCGRDGD